MHGCLSILVEIFPWFFFPFCAENDSGSDALSGKTYTWSLASIQPQRRRIKTIWWLGDEIWAFWPVAYTCYPDCKVNGSLDPKKLFYSWNMCALGQKVLFIVLNTLNFENINVFKNRIAKKIAYVRWRILCVSVIKGVSWYSLIT